MEALTAKAALVDPATFEGGGNAITTRIPRSEIEEALRADGPSDLFLDVARVRDGDAEQREVEAEQRITVSWDPDDLEKLLASTTADEVTFAFKPEELARMLDESEVEAHGLREKAAILTVAAATATGIAAGAASAMPAAGDSAGVDTSATPAFVTDTTSSGPAAESGILQQEQAFRVSEQSAQAGGDLAAEEHAFRMSEQSEGAGAGGTNLITDTMSSGPQAPAEEAGGTNLVTDTTSSGPQAPVEEAGAGGFLTDATSSGPQAPVEATGGGTNLITDTTSSGPGPSVETASASGGGQSFLESTGGEAALAGGLALLILGAGFIGTRQRRGVQPA